MTGLPPRILAGIAVVLAMVLLDGSPCPAQQSPPDSTGIDSLRPAPAVSEAGLDSLRGAQSNARVGGGVEDGTFVMSKDPGWAAFRSAVIPGWGQVYTGSWFWGAVFFGVDAGFIYGATVQHRRYEDALDASKRTKTDQQRVFLEQQANFYRDDRNRLIWYSAGVMLMASLDAYVRAHLYDFEIDPTLGTPPEGGGVTAGIRITFDL